MSGRSEFIWMASRWVWANRSPGKASSAPIKAQMAAKPNFSVSLVTGILSGSQNQSVLEDMPTTSFIYKKALNPLKGYV